MGIITLSEDPLIFSVTPFRIIKPMCCIKMFFSGDAYFHSVKVNMKQGKRFKTGNAGINAYWCETGPGPAVGN